MFVCFVFYKYTLFQTVGKNIRLYTLMSTLMGEIFMATNFSWLAESIWKQAFVALESTTSLWSH